jgi:hypothetical protein
VTGGLIAQYRNRGNVRLSLYRPNQTGSERVAYDVSVPPDGEEHRVVLKSPHSGLHQLQWSDGDDRTRIAWPENQPLTMRSALDERDGPSDNWTLYFYVPRGTASVGGFSTGVGGLMCDGDGQTVCDFGQTKGPGYFNVPVPKGQDGRLWRFERSSGQRLLMTVPPYLARNAAELLLPKEVVDRDAK